MSRNTDQWFAMGAFHCWQQLTVQAGLPEGELTKWRPFLDQSLPREILQLVEHKEEKLRPFHDSEQNFMALNRLLR